MAYRGKRYSIAQEGPDAWKWMVELNDTTHEAGVSKSRETALTSVVLAIDRLLRQSQVEARLA